MSTNTTITSPALDPFKRVKYSTGLILGVDEFEQEQYYLMHRDDLHTRLLHGYGTVCGLQVSITPGDDGPQVQVSAGAAVDTHGRHICVSETQCASLNGWLTANRDAVAEEETFSPPGTLALHVVLCHRECETDSVPVPGGPCRSQEESFIASRISDDFELRLQTNAPAQLHEDAARQFGALLAHMEIADEAPAYLTADAMTELVRGLIEGAHPEETLYLRPDEACDLLALAARVWTTDVRPQMMGAACCGTPEEACILLATLHIPLDEAWGIAGDITVDESQRPLLLSTRLLQEWLLCGRQAHYERRDVREFATLLTPKPTLVRLWVHQPTLIDFGEDAVELFVDEVAVPIGSITRHNGVNVFDLELRVEEEQVLEEGQRLTLRLDSAAVEVQGDWATLLDMLIDQRIDYLNRSPENHLFVYGVAHLAANAIQHGDAAGGDLRGTYPNPTVRALQGNQVSTQSPSEGNVLMWVKHANGTTSWTPSPLPEGEGGAQRLNDLEDVDVSNATDGQILIKRGDMWLPGNIPQGGTVEGAFVQVPSDAGAYAIVAAGIFNDQGQEIRIAYNALISKPQGNGLHLLTFERYKDLFEKEVVFIVKGTIVEPLDPAGSRTAMTPSPVFIVREMTIEGILIEIRAAALTAQRLQEAIQSDFSLEGNLLETEHPTGLMFMVEISAYGDGVKEILA
ncbi:MAG: hypothetical protein D6802_02850 [Ardenticatenia bacterium]|nr:MAG: hypothetical protein D6802_02850 [Ardenticatenia bacterium]